MYCPIDLEKDNLKALVKALNTDLNLYANMLSKQYDRLIDFETEIEKLKKQAAYWEAKAMEYKALLESIETYSCVCLTPEIKDPIGDAHARGYNEAVEQIWEAIKDVLENKEGVK